MLMLLIDCGFDDILDPLIVDAPARCKVAGQRGARGRGLWGYFAVTAVRTVGGPDGGVSVPGRRTLKAGTASGTASVGCNFYPSRRATWNVPCPGFKRGRNAARCAVMKRLVELTWLFRHEARNWKAHHDSERRPVHPKIDRLTNFLLTHTYPQYAVLCFWKHLPPNIVHRKRQKKKTHAKRNEYLPWLVNQARRWPIAPSTPFWCSILGEQPPSRNSRRIHSSKPRPI